MDLKKLKLLIDLVKESGISELELSEGTEKVRIAKAVVGLGASQYMVNSHPQNFIPQATAQPAPSVALMAAVEPEGHVIKAPMVGTFYSASSPNAPPFVEIGQGVAEGDTLCIIEAMKLMNEIESDANGIMRTILVKNGQSVENGQPLFIIG
jgi:acetyl-CoA carboxylase biotin carboxyl carrier protein